jgi:hypothetical protein
MEEYKNCVESYQISNLGNIRKTKPDGSFIEIKGSVDSRGYKYFQLQKNGKRINYAVHVLVANAFIGERPINLVVDHINRNKLDNTMENLRYVTVSDNVKNSVLYHDDIDEQDPIKRKSLVSKKYREKNKEILTVKKAEYYKNNKHKWVDSNGKFICKKVEVKCSNCSKIREVTASSARQSKSDWCIRCSAKKNLDCIKSIKDSDSKNSD